MNDPSPGARPPARRTLRVGCPMWAHAPWVGRFLSPQHRGRELAEYARWCNSVEGNTTFYAVPSAATIGRWAELAPDDFRFAFKLPRTITHERRLVGADDLVTEFLERIEPLGPRVGPLHVQLPPSFTPVSTRVLVDFVRRLPGDRGWTVELRHRGFFEGAAGDRVDDLLLEHGIGRVVLDTRPLTAVPPRSDAAWEERRTKPSLPIRATVPGPNPVVRVIGADEAEVTARGLETWTSQLTAWLDEGREPYLFVHQPENVDSPALARRIHEAVRTRLEQRSDLTWRLAPLPEPLPVAPRSEVAGQESLF